MAKNINMAIMVTIMETSTLSKPLKCHQKVFRLSSGGLKQEMLCQRMRYTGSHDQFTASENARFLLTEEEAQYFLQVIKNENIITEMQIYKRKNRVK